MNNELHLPDYLNDYEYFQYMKELIRYDVVLYQKNLKRRKVMSSFKPAEIASYVVSKLENNQK